MTTALPMEASVMFQRWSSLILFLALSGLAGPASAVTVTLNPGGSVSKLISNASDSAPGYSLDEIRPAGLPFTGRS